mmetsp:Transcript_108930/g.150664  ORF Transcript_108930/g.150664 Transcript_108930/m.150664 type:complete len:202 (-) Transcript_108930:4092-4697(-)
MTNWVSLSHLSREESEIEAALDLLTILLCSQPESIILLKFEGDTLGELILEVAIVELFVNMSRLLCHSHVGKYFGKVKTPLTDVIIGREEVTVPSLYDKEIILSRSSDVVYQTVVEASLSIAAPVMSICLFLFFIIDVGLDVNIAAAFSIDGRYIFSVKYRKTELIVKLRLCSNIPNLLSSGSFLVVCFNFNPHLDNTLRK